MTGYKNSNLFNNNGWQILPAIIVIFFAQTSIAAPPPYGSPIKKYNNDNEFVPEKLKDPPDMPFLPPYSASQPSYSNILAFKRVPDQPVYSLTFHVKETPEEVMAFYRGAFKNNKWTPPQKDSNPRTTSGSRPGATAIVNVMNPIQKGYRAQVYLLYRIYGKVH